jgi:hypothetical protein
LLVAVSLFMVSPAGAQTLDELRRENEELKEKLRLVQENNDLKLKIEAARTGTTVPNADAPAPNPQPTATRADGNPGPRAASADTLAKIEGVANLFSTGDGKVVNSVCEEQRLESDAYNVYDKEICGLATTLVRENRRHGRVLFETGQIRKSTMVFVLGDILRNQPTEATLNADLKRFILDAENKRNDKQIGGDSKSSGTTSLAVKGGVPRFFSWAVESGAATSSRSGNTLTFRINPVGLADSFSRHRFATDLGLGNPLDERDPFTNSLSKFSVGLSFDVTRGTETPTFVGSKQQLSAFSIRYNLLNRKDPMNPAYIADWRRFGKTALEPYAVRIYESSKVLVCSLSEDEDCDVSKFVNADLEAWRADTEKKLQNDVELNALKSEIELVESVRRVLVEQIAKLPMSKLKADPSIVKGATEQGLALLNYVAEKRKLDEKIAKGEVLTFEYTNYREVNAPDVSNFRFIAEKGFGDNWNLTANASISFLNKRPTDVNVKRIREFDFTLLLEKPLMELSFGRPIFSFAGMYQRIPSNILGPDGLVAANSAGDVALGQLKLVIPINGTGIKIPLSVTFANRTEFVKEATVRGNFGFTFDLDRLLLGRKLF